MDAEAQMFATHSTHPTNLTYPANQTDSAQMDRVFW